MKDKIKKAVKKAGKPAISAIFDFLMLRANQHKGRRLFDASELKMVREALLTQNLFGMDGHKGASFEREFAEMYNVPMGTYHPLTTV